MANKKTLQATTLPTKKCSCECGCLSDGETKNGAVTMHFHREPQRLGRSWLRQAV
jgi:hypothetical protein